MHKLKDKLAPHFNLGIAALGNPARVYHGSS
jgi:hypothetical protein